MGFFKIGFLKTTLISVRTIASPISAVLAGTVFICCGYASLNSTFALKLNQTNTPMYITGIILALYYLGSVLASLTAYRFVNKVGNIRAFSAFSSLLSALVLTHAFSQNHFFWALLRLSEGYCIGTISMCLESWLNTRATNRNRGVIMSLYMITTYLGSGIGQLSLNIPDHSGYLMYILISIIFSVALIPVSLTALPAPNIQMYKSMPLKKAFSISPVGFLCCISSGILVGTFYLLGTIYASNLGLSVQEVSLFMFFGVFGGLLAQFPLGKISDMMDRRYVLIGICAALCLIVPVSYFMASKSILWLILSTLLLGSCVFTLYPISVSHINDLISDDERVNASGLLILAQNVGLIAGPVIVSIGMTYFGNAFFMAAFLAIPIIFITFAVTHIKKKPDINYVNVTPTTPTPTTPTHAYNEITRRDTLLSRAKDLLTEKKE